MRIDELDHTTLSPGEQKDIPQEKLDKIIVFLQEHCKIIIDQYRNSQEFLLHGQRNMPDVFLGRSRDSRPPVDTLPQAQTLIDEKLKGAGFTALRGNSIFCTSAEVMAGDYGTLYVIFPVDGFSFTWTPKVSDFSGRYYLNYPEDAQRFIEKNKDLSPREFVRSYGFLRSSLKMALLSGYEIYINGSYVAVRYGTPMNEQIFEALRITI
jgi:hypothetical protein